MSSRYYDDYSSKSEKCRACTDFKSWTKNQAAEKIKHDDKNSDLQKVQCPPDREELGRCGWSLLHTVAAYFPERPADGQKRDADAFVRLFARLYPCRECAQDFREDIASRPPTTGSRKEFSEWLCEAHNRVNVKLGKPPFDCSKVEERWRTGWKDGSCD
ncbi:hypothetical protein JTE90_014980 [Oedothorax gibbosus]|uniref:Sulfhydryl oxidase n=1 Tax=Oedothorax gibbosus TaxID=931172 RepID=A0AAV6UYL9_9ARAC|nr:hypothetical protein JTE90_014980 [Oedothorax gibbosus]